MSLSNRSLPFLGGWWTKRQPGLRLVYHWPTSLGRDSSPPLTFHLWYSHLCAEEGHQLTNSLTVAPTGDKVRKPGNCQILCCLGSSVCVCVACMMTVLYISTQKRRGWVDLNRWQHHCTASVDLVQETHLTCLSSCCCNWTVASKVTVAYYWTCFYGDGVMVYYKKKLCWNMYNTV